MTDAFGLSRLNYDAALKLISGGRFDVEPLLTHRFGLDDIASAVATAEQGSAIKVAIVDG